MNDEDWKCEHLIRVPRAPTGIRADRVHSVPRTRKRKKCLHPECDRTIPADNKAGMCRNHKHLFAVCRCDKCKQRRKAACSTGTQNASASSAN